MGRKERRPKARLDTPLSPYMHHHLMVGRDPQARIHGWAEFMLMWDAELAAAIAAAWESYGDDLIAEAAAFDFIPWGVRHRRPTGDGVKRWQQPFIAQHRY